MFPYTPPDGFYDQPFSWIFDGSGLTDGANALNLGVSIQAGWGDFILRRVAGLKLVVNPTAGQYQIKDQNLNPFQSDPEFVSPGSDQLVVIPEILYKENTAIRFDLYDVLRAFNTVGGKGSLFTAQLCFQGVRRLSGTTPVVTPYSFKPRSFVYALPFALPISGTVNGITTGAPTTFTQQVIDYDFELHNLQIVYTSGQGGGSGTGTAASTTVSNATSFNGTTWTLKAAGAAGNSWTLTIQIDSSRTISGDVTFTVIGTAITATVAPNTSFSELASLANADAGVSAVATVIAFGPYLAGFPVATATAQAFQGGSNTGGFTPGSTKSFLSLLLYDYNKNICSNIPGLDVFFNELSGYTDGAIVPPLLYKKDGQIRVDLFNNTRGAIAGVLYFVGKQRYPC